MYTLNCGGKLLSLQKPVVMGIINANDNSFYKDSRKSSLSAVLSQAEDMLKEGASILDIGGQSTNPFSKLFSADEELLRVLPAVEAIHQRFPDVIISVDTFYASVAEACIQVGATIVNDISAGMLDDNMLSIVAKYKVPYIAMHMRGTPQTMQTMTRYQNLIAEILDYFTERLSACKNAGIKDVIIDPGFGFAKTVEQNFLLLKNLSVFKSLHALPLLVGISRKSMIYKTLQTNPENALNGTTVLNTIALQNGANILRVHDVKQAVEAVELLDILNKPF